MPDPSQHAAAAARGQIRRGRTELTDPVEAARDLAERIGGTPAALRVIYASPAYDLDVLGPALTGELADAPLIGCTTAGEIGPGGYLGSEGLVGLSLPADDFTARVDHYPGIRDMAIMRMSEIADDHAMPARERESAFGVLLVDGLSMREEAVVSAVHGALGDIPICGGSAGDRLDFGSTKLLVDGRFVEDAATLAVVRTRRPFQVFKLQHFLATERKVVVTAADTSRRMVTEIDGLPAAEGYARAVGMSVDRLTPQLFSTHPVVVRVGGAEYVRSIQQVLPDGSLVFYCAIDEGIVLTVASGVDMVRNLEAEVEALEAQLGAIDLTIGFDCILRRLECNEKGLTQDIDPLLERLSMCGFATYGEQFGAMHVNQTLTGVAIGARAS